MNSFKKAGDNNQRGGGFQREQGGFRSGNNREDGRDSRRYRDNSRDNRDTRNIRNGQGHPQNHRHVEHHQDERMPEMVKQYLLNTLMNQRY